MAKLTPIEELDREFTSAMYHLGTITNSGKLSGWNNRHLRAEHEKKVQRVTNRYKERRSQLEAEAARKK